MTRAEYRARVEWLSRAYRLDKSIKNLTEKINFLKATAQGTCIKINPDPMAGGFDGSKVETKVVNYVDLEHRRDKLANDLVTARKEINEAIIDVEDPAAFAVLSYRYINYLSWEIISESLRLPFENRYVFQVHRKGVGQIHLPQGYSH